MKRRALILILITLMLPAAPADQATFMLASGDYGYHPTSDGGAIIIRYTGSDAEITIPDTLDGRPVRAIGELAFYENEILISVTIPDGVVMIEKFAFWHCPALERVSIGAGVATVKANPFIGCGALKCIEVSDENEVLEVIDQALFFGPENRLITYPAGLRDSEYAAPSGTEIIGDEAFSFCAELASVTMPGSVKVIGNGAFVSCPKLEHVSLSAGVEKIGDSPFAMCKSLKTVQIAPDHEVLGVIGGMLICKPEARLIGYLGGLPVGGCEVPEGIKTIGVAFIYCENLTRITLPDSVVNIESGAFMGCLALESVNIPAGVTKIGAHTFLNCSALSDVSIPESVQEIGSSAFSGCTSLTGLTIPEGVTYIAWDAFYRCSSLTLTVYPNSYAEKYAEEYAVPFIYPD